MTPPTLLQRLKERKLVQWGLAYLAGAFFIYTGLDPARETWGVPEGVIRGVHILLIAGFFIALVLAWYHGEKGRQRVSGPELLMVAALLVVAGVALSMLGGQKGDTPAGEMSSAVETDDPRPSIAVLPLDDNSPDPEDAYIARGIHDKIISALGEISSLSVKARTSVDQYGEARPSVPEIAAALGVDFLLEGTAEVVGSVVRVAVRLIDARLDEVLWNHSMQTEYLPAEAIRIEIEIAEGVASGLSVAISPEEEARITAVPTNDSVAYRLVDRARYLWNQRTDPEIREAVELYQQAIERDPLYLDAYVGLASAYLMLGEYGLDQSGLEVAYRLAVTTAERALELDPTLSIPHGVIAHAKVASEWDWEGADQEYRTALLLEPDQSQIHCWYSLFLASVGRGEDALRELSIAQRLDPLAPWLAHGAPLVHYYGRDYERSIEVGLRNIAADLDNSLPYQWVCYSYLELARFDEGIQVCEVAYRSGEPWPLDARISAYRGERDAALRALEKYETSGEPTWGRAQVHAILGDVDEAFRWLRQAIEEYRFRVYLLPGDPVYDSLRSDPRWAEILEQIGFEG
jgi:TolB-like protein